MHSDVEVVLAPDFVKEWLHLEVEDDLVIDLSHSTRFVGTAHKAGEVAVANLQLLRWELVPKEPV